MIDHRMNSEIEPHLPDGLAGEFLRQAATALARHLLTLVGGALITLGWVQSDVFQTWANAHTVEVVGLILTGVAFLWSWLHKKTAAKELATAISLHPRKWDNTPRTIADVRERARRSPGAIRRLPPPSQPPTRMAALALALLLVAGQTACFFGGATPTEKFARANAELRVYVQEANTVIDALLDANAISPDVAIGLVTGLRGVNAGQRELITEALKYAQTDSKGNEVLVITEAGRLRLADLSLSLITVGTNVVNHPLIPGIPDATRTRLTTALLLIPPVIVQLQSLVRALKAQKTATQPLRLQVASGTTANWRLLIPELERLDRTMAEAVR